MLRRRRSSPTLSRAIVFVAIALAAAACGDDPSESPPAASPPDGESTANALQFVDATADSGIDYFVSSGGEDKKHLLESTGSGVGVADVDGDGLEDVYLTTQQPTDAWLRGERPLANALYRNRGDGTFEDIAARAGVDLRAWSCGAYFADVDNDGDADLFVTAWGSNVFYRNRGDGTYQEDTARAGLGGGAADWSAGAAFGDLDGDGDLDLYVANYAEYDLASPPFDGAFTDYKGIQVFRGPLGFVAQADRVYRNRGNGTFEEIADTAGFRSRAPLFGLGVVFLDDDDDGDLDVYVANDSTDNFLFRNEGDFTFREIGTLAGVATNEDAKQQAGMGTDAGDIDGDGRIDLVVTNFSHDWNTIYRNLGGGSFRDVTFESGLQDTYLPLAWGVKLFDADGDGDLDLFVANGHIYPWIDDAPQLGTTYRQANLLYRNRGDGTFEDVGARAGSGLALIEGTRGTAAFDSDGDGDLDLLLTNLDGPARLLRNESRQGVSTRFMLEGVDSPRDGTGARLTATIGSTRVVRVANPFGSYLSTGTRDVHVGSGESRTIDVLEVRWPSGRRDRFENVAAGERYRLREGDAPKRLDG